MCSRLMKDMTEPELKEYIGAMLDFFESRQTQDTTGAILVLFGDDGIAEFGATIDVEMVPGRLRVLADRIEQRQTLEH